MTEISKTCSRCKVSFPLDSFTKDKSRKDGKSSRCKSCMKELAQKYHTPEYNQTVKLASRYNITVEQSVSIKSNGCYLCGSFDKLCIDHNHKTNEVRGCLCHQCNISLGNYEYMLDRFGAETLEKYRNGRI
jgi:hypothetical protein